MMIATLLSVFFALALCAATTVIATSLHQHRAALLDARDAWRTCPESLTVRFQIREIKVEQRPLAAGATVLALPVRRAAREISQPERLAA